MDEQALLNLSTYTADEQLKNIFMITTTKQNPSEQKTVCDLCKSSLEPKNGGGMITKEKTIVCWKCAAEKVNGV